MKIGVFGDSFAEKNAEKIWWKFLQGYGHKVTCFGENGSSIVWSAKQILDTKNDFDFVIWCVTSSNRITVWHRANFTEKYVHVLGTDAKKHSDPEIQQKIDATEKFIQIAMDEPDREFVGKCVVEYVKTQVPNMLLIPCFPVPLYDSVENAGFNLFDLYQKETRYFFPSKSHYDVQTEYRDLRQGHFCESTHVVLAEEISKSLHPGIFVSDYDKFPKPPGLFDQFFQRR